MKRYVLGHVAGKVVVLGEPEPECCERCGSAYHPYRKCHESRKYEEYEGE